jgi:hypothetical protein
MADNNTARNVGNDQPSCLDPRTQLRDTNRRLKNKVIRPHSFKTNNGVISTRYKSPFSTRYKPTLAACHASQRARSSATDILGAVSDRQRTRSSTVNYNVTNAARSSLFTGHYA